MALVVITAENDYRLISQALLKANGVNETDTAIESDEALPENVVPPCMISPDYLPSFIPPSRRR